MTSFMKSFTTVFAVSVFLIIAGTLLAVYAAVTGTGRFYSAAGYSLIAAGLVLTAYNSNKTRTRIRKWADAYNERNNKIRNKLHRIADENKSVQSTKSAGKPQ